ncbi:TonB-dependent receptor [Chitinophaga sp. S165]|uniref:TonB-dependent receptor n=1 Tax=Chitinophaga sp. S165 TaxID=2135462 RepID=UPI000D70BFDA|nr:TonB-dependent receptor [Chitinophaga sp. S165]PWV46593.1 iron complex outermembrane receptor protein [Chitinophaga sp. S165]
MRKYLLIFFCLLLCMNFNAQALDEASGTITGYVTTSDGAPAAAVTVEIEGMKRNTITNSKGFFQIKNVAAGTHRVRISLIGYETAIKEVIVQDNATVAIEMQLKISNTQLKEVVVLDSHNKVADKSSDYVARLQLDNLENPQSYSVATKELLQEKNVMSYESAVRSIPGMVLSAEDYQGSSNAFVRGFSTNPYIRNGIYFMNLVSGDPQNIERLEAIKGPSGTLYGSQGISYGGLINKVTKKPFSTRAGEAGLSVGGFGFSRLIADINTPVNEDNIALLRVNAAATWQQSFPNNGTQRTFLFAPSFSYKINDKLDILIDAELNSNKRTALIAYPVYSAGGYTRYDQLPLDYFAGYGSNKADYPPSTTYNFYTQINYKLGNNWRLSTNIAYSDFNYNSGTIGLYMQGPDTLLRDIYDFYWQYNSVEIQPNLTGEFKIGSVKNKLLVGLDYQDIQTLATGYSIYPVDTIDPRGPFASFPIKKVRASDAYSDSYYEAAFKQKTYGAYITDVINFNDRLNLLLSLRYDHYKDGGYQYSNTPGSDGSGPNTSALAPKLGVTYQVLKDHVTVFANYMQGLNYVAPDMSGKTFKPERAQQAEGGVKIELADGKLSSTMSYYNIRVKDIVRTDPSNPNTSIQDGTQESKGVDVDIIASPVRGLSIVAGYAYNNSKFLKSDTGKEGKRPYGTPENSGNIWVSYTLPQSALSGLGLGVGAVYTDDFFGTDDNDITIPGYTVFNANLFYNQPKFRAALSVDNAGDRRYWNVFGAPQMTRRLIASLTFRF